MNQFGLRWTEAVGRDARLKVKEKTFRTRTARDHHADLVAEKPAFVRFDAWLAPPPGSGGADDDGNDQVLCTRPTDTRSQNHE